MKRKEAIISALLIFAMAVSVMPLYDASAPAIVTNAQDTKIVITDITATPSTVNQGSAVNITCNVTANGTSKITYVNVTINGEEFSMKAYTNVNATGNGTYYYNTTYDKAGTYTYTINVTDSNGDWNATEEKTFTVNDVTKPEIKNPSATSVVEGNPVNITAVITDNVGVTWAKVSIFNETNTTIVDNATMNEINSTTHTYSYLAQNLVPGDYTFQIYANDSAGNLNKTDRTKTEAKFTVTKDEAAPVISNVAAAPASVAQGGSVNITANVSDSGVGVDAVKVNITYPDGTYHNETMKMFNGSYYYEATYDAIGNYVFFVWANDTNGNAIASSKDSFAVTDGIPPEINDVNASVNNNIVTITANVTDNVGVTTVTVTILNWNDATVADAQEMTLNNGTYTYTSGALPLGNYTYAITASDAAGNTNSSSAKSFAIVDKEPPVISNITIAPQNPVEKQNVMISCVVTDNIEVASVVITIDGTAHNMTLSGGEYTYTISSVTFGDHTFTITATDTSGNSVASSQQTFSAADADKPTASPSSTNPTKATLGSTITIQYTASDPDGIQSVVLYYVVDNGTEQTVTMTLANGTYSAEIALPKDAKTLTYWVNVTDSDGSHNPNPQHYTIKLEKQQQSSSLSPALLAGIGILILVIIIAAAWAVKKKGSTASAEETEEEGEEETGESEENEEEPEESEEDLE